MQNSAKENDLKFDIQFLDLGKYIKEILKKNDPNKTTGRVDGSLKWNPPICMLAQSA